MSFVRQGGATAPLVTAAVVLAMASAGVAPAFVALAALAGALWVRCTRSTATAPPGTVNPPAATADVHRSMHRDERLANTVHELRTPLTAVITAIEMLRDGYAETDEDREMCLTQAVVAARHLSFVINDVLDVAALESGRLSLHIRDHWLHELLADVRQVMGLAASANGIELLVDEPAGDLRLRTDRGRFLQISINLLGNAIKYSPQGGEIELRIRATGNRLRFEVLDAGVGVPPQNRDRLFTRFGRAHSATNSDVGGTGLGLHLCAQLVELQDGAIGYEPRSPRGSVFWFELPRSAPAAGQTVAETIAADR